MLITSLCVLFVIMQSSNGVADEDFVSYVGKWREAGASLFGGCCRTTPNTIKAISNTLSEKSYLTKN